MTIITFFAFNQTLVAWMCSRFCHVIDNLRIIVFSPYHSQFARKWGKSPEILGLYPYRFRVYPLQNCWFIPNFAPWTFEDPWQGDLWKLTSITVFQTTPWQTTHHATDKTMQVTLDADKSTRFASIYAFKKGHEGTPRNGSSLLFTCKTRTLFL